MTEFSASVLTWFRENGRELPWRGTRDPYAVWLSEIILQQTQVKQGWEYWQRFMRRWPTVEQLAAATEDEVLREWQGLGYYSRARNLHFAARQIVGMGGFPQTLDGIRQLKGVGDYTAAAIGSIAFGLPAAVVDGNVYRLLSRYFGIDTPINTSQGKKVFTALAQSLLPEAPAATAALAEAGSIYGEFNQAMMDFGAMQCTPQSPRCPLCPLQDSCVALREGRIGQLPVKRKTLKVKERHLVYVYVRWQGMTAIRRRPAGDIWQGLWEPLLIESEPAAPLGADITPNRLSISNTQHIITASQLIKKGVRHVLTHRVLYADFYLWEPAEKPALPADYIWIAESDIDSYAVPRLVEQLLSAL